MAPEQPLQESDSHLELDDPIRGPLRCDFCGRFVSQRDARIGVESGDYGTSYSAEVMCLACDDSMREDSPPSYFMLGEDGYARQRAWEAGNRG